MADWSEARKRALAARNQAEGQTSAPAGIGALGLFASPAAAYGGAIIGSALEGSKERDRKTVAAKREVASQMLPALDQDFLRVYGQGSALEVAPPDYLRSGAGMPGGLAGLAWRGAERPPAGSEALPVVNWEKAGQRLQWKSDEDYRTPRTQAEWAVNIPKPGPDQGATRFGRGYVPEMPDAKLAYTVVPNVNSARFKDSLLPALIDQSYRRDAGPYLDYDPSDFVDGGSRKVPRIWEFPAKADEARVLPRDRLVELSPAERTRLLETWSPGQTEMRGMSGYIWGTVGEPGVAEYPRYEYARSMSRSLGKTTNPEVVLSEVRTPPELEADYLFTSDTHDPFVEYKGTPRRTYEDPVEGEIDLGREKALGPSWGIGDAGSAVGTVPGRRSKSDIAGDISFRSDLIEGGRAGWSLADAQAIQMKLGLPLSVEKPDHIGNGGYTADRALEDATEAIRAKEGLKTHGEVVRRYGRPLPRMGLTTNPRQPAEHVFGDIRAEVAPAVTPRMRQAFDLPGALESAGFSPDRSGLKAANDAITRAAKSRVDAQRRGTAGGATAKGFLLDAGVRLAAGQPLDEAVVDVLADPLSAENLGGAPTAAIERLGPKGQFVDTRSNTVLSPQGTYTNQGIAYRNGKPVVVPRGSVAGVGTPITALGQTLKQAGETWSKRVEGARKAGAVDNEIRYVMNSLRRLRLPYFGR